MKLLCTLGPATFNHENIKKLTEIGADLFRINLSHTKVEDLGDLIDSIRESTSVPICLDSEGAQIRTGDFREKSYTLASGERVYIPKEYVLGERNCFNLYPLWVIGEIRVGTLISIDFNSVLGVVEKKDNYGATVKILNGGVLGQNKAVTVDQLIKLDALTEKDYAAMEIGRKKGIKHVALSFARSADDVNLIRSECNEGTLVISKIECLDGLINLDEIINVSDEILIDRGDLSREVPLETVPVWQQEIIDKATKYLKPVNVATNLLESMIFSPLPTRAELNDVYNTIKNGASGLVLAAETAIGKYPIQCATMIKKIIKTYDLIDHGSTASDLLPIDFLPLPHGGKLVQNFIDFDDAKSGLIIIDLPYESILDIEQISHGTFSPINEFMGVEELESVIFENKCKSGEIWTLPIILQADDSLVKHIGSNREVVVNFEGMPHSFLKIKKISKINFSKYINDWFGTDSLAHPGVNRILSGGDWIIEATPFLLDQFLTCNTEVSFTPRQLRSIFQRLGWMNVVGFHTRNIPHAAHEYIQSKVMADINADGLLISPVLGTKKRGDFESDVIIDVYDLFVNNKNITNVKYLLSGFGTYARYAGPREAVFTALCRKNMGCSYFIVGRDHTGVGDFYSPYASQKIFECIGDIGIEIVACPEYGFNKITNKFEEITHDVSFETISGTELRNKITLGEHMPHWFVNHQVQDYIIEQKKLGRRIFVE